jgi:hypothetical protein
MDGTRIEEVDLRTISEGISKEKKCHVKLNLNYIQFMHQGNCKLLLCIFQFFNIKSEAELFSN